MHDIRKRVKEFTKKYGIDHESIDMEINCRLFIEEMESGLSGRGSSLEMIPTYITMNDEIPVDEPVIVIDAGGTNFRTALVHFDCEKKPVIEDFNLHHMPGSKGEIGRDEFFETIAGYIRPLLHRSDKLSFCFSYPVEILPNRDGRLIRFTKEVKVRGLEGNLIGAGLADTLKRTGCADKKSIVMLNDTVATLLGGKAAYPGRVFDSYMGLILGTGTNTCYTEEMENITKIAGATDFSAGAVTADTGKSPMIVNIESGGYSRAPRGPIDDEFDNGTNNPGKYMFEKMISGAYQGGLFLVIVKKAAGEGLLSRDFSLGLKHVEALTSKDIDNFLYYQYSSSLGGILTDCCSAAGTTEGENDRKALYYLADALIERAARLVAINLTAVIMKTGRGKNPCAPVCIAADGTTFYKSKLFRTKLDYYVKTFMNEEKGIYCEFVKADNATLLGTAIAGLTI